jgi:hypothetical protein
MARASNVTLRIRAADVPLLPGAFDLADAGCLPGACFRNQTALDVDLTAWPERAYQAGARHQPRSRQRFATSAPANGTHHAPNTGCGIPVRANAERAAPRYNRWHRSPR